MTRPVRTLKVTIQRTSATQASVSVEAQGMTRLDIYVNDRPLQSLDLDDGRATFTIAMSPTSTPMLELRGFLEGQLVARYRTQVIQ